MQVRRALSELAHEHGSALAGRLVQQVLDDPQNRAWKLPWMVDDQLPSKVATWLDQLFKVDSSVEAWLADQARAGEFHVRFQVPATLLLRSVRVLRRLFIDQLSTIELPADASRQAAEYVDELMGLAVEAIATSAEGQARRLLRCDEDYRLSMIGRDLRGERDRRCRELLEWVQWVIDRHLQGPGAGSTIEPEPASFSLWLRHKAPVLFDDSPELALIRSDLRRIARPADAGHVGGGNASAAMRQSISLIRRSATRATQHLEALFDRHNASPDARDHATALLHRRYFAPIAQRELQRAQLGSNDLALLMIELDAFEATVAARGPDAANVLLTQMAAIIDEHIRAGDFVFRIAPAAFAVLLVECDEAAAAWVAEGLGRRVAACPVTWQDGDTTRVTACIGVAPFDGQPDHQQLLDRADHALRLAQAAGPGNCRVARQPGDVAD